jgi:DNA polymerase elongation subunit (family B)
LYQNLISIYWDIESYCPDTRPSNVNSNSDNNKGSIVLNSIPYIISMSHWNYGKNKENFNVCLSTRMFSCMDKKIIVPNLNIDNIYFDNNTNTFNIYVRDTCDLLISFAKLIKYFKPDIMSGFNDNQYDWAVINNTAHNLNI